MLIYEIIRVTIKITMSLPDRKITDLRRPSHSALEIHNQLLHSEEIGSTYCLIEQLTSILSFPADFPAGKVSLGEHFKNLGTIGGFN